MIFKAWNPLLYKGYNDCVPRQINIELSKSQG